MKEIRTSNDWQTYRTKNSPILTLFLSLSLSFKFSLQPTISMLWAISIVVRHCYVSHFFPYWHLENAFAQETGEKQSIKWRKCLLIEQIYMPLKMFLCRFLLLFYLYPFSVHPFVSFSACRCQLTGWC